ncbi:MAG TPA: hypothetical protein VMG08_06000 [Allosphingosinicella sp.]|nr:hypothetical protein [Allosphingosinicella sp.]
MNRAAAIVPLLVAAGCASPAEAAYREAVECLSQYPEGEMRPGPPGSEMPGRTVAVVTAERDAFRARALEHGRAIGKSPADVAADARAFHDEILGPDAHGTEERMEALGATCRRRLAG